MSLMMQHARLMLVDDEPANLRLLQRMLASHGYTNVEAIQDPREVLPRYRAQRPDLILLDLNMPHLSGFEVMAQLRALADPLLPPIVVLTAQPGRDFLLRALDAGARDYLTKPFDLNELAMRVRNLLQAHLAHRLLHDQAATLEALVRERTEEVRRTRLQVVQRLGRAAEYRDEETGHHILRMSHMAAHLARTVGWDDAAVELMLHAAPMHDIGKIGIPDAVLLKPGRFEPHEWEIMKTHATIGAQLLDGDDSDLLRMARDIAWTHHEKWDGSGYPRGLAGEDIPEAGRIVALADVFDALTSARPYKRAWPVEEAVALLREQRGRHFEPRLVDAFLDELPAMLAIRARWAEPAPAA
ncbi:Cyclic di-GMP phosphodiesterase response regulator RpfG [Tepidimonas sediminis]|uniref:Cyclic di-GMP phosphodiesterase response regulator RpfG n=1 Tax=Tepidimonas sediminis TaxID=2588941 RepID=A0A554WQL9_9BURK|nr:HD domain-containing phosphohydrolase [Tepidimonas sediminis]TSE25876.1 Cyclic di-GMP phosphodiesterase response regulator RpfG [Tepidimonas sediminis]